MIASFGLIRQLPHPNDSQRGARSYVIKFRNAAPFPMYFDLITIEAVDGQGQGRDIDDDTNIFKNVGHDEAEDMRPEDFEHVNGILNEELNLRYEDADDDNINRVKLVARTENDQFLHGKNQAAALNLRRHTASRPLPHRSERPSQPPIRNLRKQFKKAKYLNQELKLTRNKRSEIRAPENVTSLSRVENARRNDSRIKMKEFTKKVTVSTISMVKVNKRHAASNDNIHKDERSTRSRRQPPHAQFDNHAEYAIRNSSPVSPNSPLQQHQHPHATPNLSFLHYNSSERRNVVFLKVHKAASTTVFGIMMRFAFSRQLDVMLPNATSVITETTPVIDPSALLPYPSHLRFNMICNHIVYNRDQIFKFMRSLEKTVFIGIIRDPFEQFVSAFTHYLNVLKRPLLVQIAMDHPRNPIRGFLDNPLKYSDFPKYDLGVTFINNRMATDLGFPMWNLEMDKYNDDLMKRFLKETEQNFHLIMVAELFPESLVLMKRLLNWKVKDILYIRQKDEMSAQEQMKIPWNTDVEFSVEDKKNHKLFAPVDYALYEHFKGVLLEKIQTQGPDFAGEVAMLKTVLKDLASFCETAEEDSELLISSNPWTQSFSVGVSDCKLMTLGESDLTELARKIQTKRPTQIYDAHERFNFAQRPREKMRGDHGCAMRLCLLCSMTLLTCPFKQPVLFTSGITDTYFWIKI
ncbi:Galactosylceramide sulfotransferase [Bulinus truncatus]|nr:Galactosylceramide sulfotransferase [Bulinus truncatus]